MNAFDASSEKSLGTPSDHEEHAVPAVLGLAVYKSMNWEVSNEECERVVIVRGVEPWDIHISELLSGRITLDGFLLKVLVSGFSCADVLEWARGVPHSKYFCFSLNNALATFTSLGDHSV